MRAFDSVAAKYSRLDLTRRAADETGKLGVRASSVAADLFNVARKIKEQEEQIAALKGSIGDVE